MHAVQSALAIRRERTRRKSLRESKKGKKGDEHRPSQASLDINEALIEPPKQKGSLTYFNVGVAFVLIGCFLIFPAFVPNDALGPDWNHLLGIGIVLVVLGCIMVAINQMKTNSEETALEKYVTNRLTRTKSGNPLIKDVEYGELEETHSTEHSRKSSLEAKESSESHQHNGSMNKKVSHTEDV